MLAPEHIMQPHSAPMNSDFPELDGDSSYQDDLEIPSFFTSDNVADTTSGGNRTDWQSIQPSRPLKKMGHANKHLKDFQKIDSNLTAHDVAKILEYTRRIGNPSSSSHGSTNYDAIINIGGQDIPVRVNVSSGGLIKTGYPVGD